MHLSGEKSNLPKKSLTFFTACLASSFIPFYFQLKNLHGDYKRCSSVQYF